MEIAEESWCQEKLRQALSGFYQLRQAEREIEELRGRLNTATTRFVELEGEYQILAERYNALFGEAQTQASELGRLRYYNPDYLPWGWRRLVKMTIAFFARRAGAGQ